MKLVRQGALEPAADLDFSRLAVRFHAGGDIYGVAPEIIGVFPDANDAGYDGPAVQAKADLLFQMMMAVEYPEGLQKLKGDLDTDRGMIRTDHGYATH